MVRALAVVAVATLVVLIYLAVVLRLPSARSMLRGLLRAGWIWVAVIAALGLFEAWQRWA